MLRRECVDTAATLIGSWCRRRDCLSVRSGVARQARRGSLGSERARTRRRAASGRSTRLPAVVDRGNVRVSTGRTGGESSSSRRQCAMRGSSTRCRRGRKRGRGGDRMGKRSGLRREVVGFVRRYEVVPRSVKRQRATSFGEARMGGGCVRVPLLEGRVEAQQPGLASSLVGLAGSLRRIAGTRGSETRRRGCRRVAKSRRRHRTMIDSVSIAVD